MKFPAYGRALWQRRLLGERPRVAFLLIGNIWRKPKWLTLNLAEVPRLAVKTAPWHESMGAQLDWRVVAEMTVLAIDVRGPDERVEREDGWDSWFWLLAEMQRYARDILMFTPMIDFLDPPRRFAPERTLEVYAWLNRDPNTWKWPPWWPYENTIYERELAA